MPDLFTEEDKVSITRKLHGTNARYEFYHRKEEKIPFDLEYFNKITKGGLPAKTLNIALAGTGVGKSLFMCHVAAGCMTQGKNVLYITMEMAEEKIAERIDANLLNVTVDDLVNLPKEMYDPMFKRADSVDSAVNAILEYEDEEMSERIAQLVAKLHHNFFSATRLIDCLKQHETTMGLINKLNEAKGI